MADDANFDGLVGGNCAEDDDCTDNSQCNDNDVCACEDGYSLHITDGSCEFSLYVYDN